MFRALFIALAILASFGVTPAQTPSKPAKAHLVKASLHPALAIPFDLEAEAQLLALANEARAQGGLPPLQASDGLTDAARHHAALMAGQAQLSHQFSGEPDLARRLAAASDLHLDRAGENVGFADTPQQVQQGFMSSPPHRENLLNNGYNVAGIGVVRSGDKLYVVQDFGHELPSYSADASEKLVSASLDRLRQQAGLPALQRLDAIDAGRTACAMAEADSLKARVSGTSATARYILRYTSNDPTALPVSASNAVSDRSLQSFGVGSCYARTTTYPNGVYWVALFLY